MGKSCPDPSPAKGRESFTKNSIKPSRTSRYEDPGRGDSVYYFHSFTISTASRMASSYDSGYRLPCVSSQLPINHTPITRCW